MRYRSLEAAQALISRIWLYGHSVLRNESQKETSQVTHMHATHEPRGSRVACPTPSALYDNDAFCVIDTNEIGMSHSIIELIYVTHTHPTLASHTAIES